MTKAIFIPGNGGGTPRDNWFPYLKKELEKLNVNVIDKDFPDNKLARQSYWIPFIKELGADENTVLIGHSTGAIATLRYAENNKILGSVIVGAYYTDLGDEGEKKSGYFNEAWNWDKIKNNQHWILQFASTDDPWIPIKEARFVNKKLGTEYFEFNNQGHFGYDSNKSDFPELLNALKAKLGG